MLLNSVFFKYVIVCEIFALETVGENSVVNFMRTQLQAQHASIN